MMTKLQFSEQELLSEHDFAQPHIVQGRRMHGGLLADGSYQPPRSLGRTAALTAWTGALRDAGGDLYDANSSLLKGERLPTVRQSQVLLRHGLGETFWNSLTITGKIEARGRLLAEAAFPDLQNYIVDDISSKAIGHLNRGLLYAHGIDEGGQPELGIGGHDEMWFVARDLVFGAHAFADVDPAESISRPEAGTRFMPEVDAAVEGILSLLMNLLMIEFRAEIGFAATQAVLRTPDLFADRREAAELAALIVERIRTDETIHVWSLRLYLGELCQVRFTSVDGGEVPGRTLITRFWDGLVRWATEDQPRQFAAMQRSVIEARLLAHDGGAEVLAEFNAAA
jgi:hypothetical protein